MYLYHFCTQTDEIQIEFRLWFQLVDFDMYTFTFVVNFKYALHSIWALTKQATFVSRFQYAKYCLNQIEWTLKVKCKMTVAESIWRYSNPRSSYLPDDYCPLRFKPLNCNFGADSVNPIYKILNQTFPPIITKKNKLLHIEVWEDKILVFSITKAA
jgi:hypothetical protein